MFNQDTEVILSNKESLTHSFYLIYFLLSTALIVSKKGSLQLRLMLIPTSLFLSACFTLIYSEWSGLNQSLFLPESSLRRYFELSTLYSDIFIPLAAIAPLWICLELMFIGPKIQLSYIQETYRTLNKFAVHSQTNTKTESLDCLLLEDDLTSADPLLKLFRKIKMSCKHIETIEEAETLFDQHKSHLKILVLDIFIRVVDPNFPRTGLDWLRELNKEYPKDKRDFIIVVYTGHQDILDAETQPMVDYVLTKPWNPREFLTYLAEKKLFQVKSHA